MKRLPSLSDLFLLTSFCLWICCGVSEHENKTGSIRIQVGDEVTIAKTAETINLVRCVLSQGTETIHDGNHMKESTQFVIEIEDLEAADDYSVFLYGENALGEVIGLCSKESIDVTEGDVTDVQLTWGRFNPVLVSPADGSTTGDNTPAFDWGDVSGSTGYEIRADNSSSFTSPEIEQSGLTSSGYTPSSSLLDGTYYWRVRSKDSQDIWSGWSATWSFTISTESIVVTNPDDGDRWIESSTHNIEWTSVGTSGNVKIEYSTNGGTTWYTVKGTTSDDGSYSWKVPDTPSENCCVRVTDTDGSPSGVSEGAFEIPRTGTMTDIDGNVYVTIKIGNQRWMAENLKVTHYRNGDAIPNVTDGTAWSGLTTGAYCNYNNDARNVATYGRLYNWYAVNESRNIAPEDWHVPSDADLKTLEMVLGMSQSTVDGTGWRGSDEGGKLKEAGTTHWHSPNTGATNSSGFTALPSGFRSYTGFFGDLGYFSYFWSTTEYDINNAWYRELYYLNSTIFRSGGDKQFGFSVRCIRD